MKKTTETSNQTPKKTTPKKPAAPNEAISSTEVATGSPAKATASGGDVQPADSTLVGKPKDPATATPAAARKADTPFEPAAKADSGADVAAPAASLAAASAPLKLENAELSLTNKHAEPGKTSSTTAAPAATKVATKSDKSETFTSSPDSTSETAQAPSGRGGFWPLVLGGVAAAVIGSAATIWALPHLPAGWVATDEPVAAIDTEALRSDVLAEARAAGEDAARTIIAEMPEGADTTPELQAAIEAQSQKIAALEAEIAAPAPSEATTEAADALPAAQSEDAGVSDEVAALRAQLDQQAQQLQALAKAAPAGNAAAIQAMTEEAAVVEERLRAAADEVSAEIEAARLQSEEMRAAAEETTRRAEAVAAVAALKSALDQGVSTDEAVSGLRDAGIEPPAAVNAEVPNLSTLQESYDGAARAGLRAALRESSANAGPGGVIANFLKAQTGARSVEPRDGSDPDAILSRAGKAVTEGDLPEALAELGALPDAAKAAPAMAEWLAGAQANVNAHGALAELTEGVPAAEDDPAADAPVTGVPEADDTPDANSALAADNAAPAADAAPAANADAAATEAPAAAPVSTPTPAEPMTDGADAPSETTN